MSGKYVMLNPYRVNLPRWPLPTPLPARADLEALVPDLPTLWTAATTTTTRDRKRLLRTLVADITVLPRSTPGRTR